MNNERLGLGIQYDHTKIADKHYFGGFLNLAENNITEVLTSFNLRFKIISTSVNFKNAKLIEEAFSDKISDADYTHRIEFLKQYFPIIRLINNPKESRSYFKETCIALFKAVSDLRNFYTHYYHKPITFSDNFLDQIDSFLFTTILDVKKNKMKDDKTRHLLSKNVSDNLDLLFKQKKEALLQLKREGKKVNLETEAIKNAVLNESFYHLLYGKEEVNRNYKAKLEADTENGISISQSGLLFLLGMFLSKKESEDLRSRVKGFKAKIIHSEELNNSIKFMATHWVFSHLAFKGSKHRLASNFQQEALLMQIIDELSKVPNEVYETLDKTNQNSFIEDINEYLKEGKEVLGLEEATVVHPVIRKRYEDKFNYFVLRYLDEFADFPSLRFQIHLGNYVHDRRTKDINGTFFQTERVVKEKIKVFSKLSAVTNLKSQYVSNQNTNEELGWEIFPNPSYNFIANNIPIFINLQQSTVPDARKLYGLITKKRLDKKAKLDEKTRAANKASKEQITQLIDSSIEGNKFKDTYIGAPLALLSANELPALLYELLVKKTSPSDIENTMVTKLIERFNTIQNYETNQNLPASQITKNLRRSTNNDTVDTAKILRAVHSELETTNQKLTLIQQNRKDVRNAKHKRKHIFTTPELGIEATWLAYDIKRFMPATARKELKGYQFAQLQHSLAKFDQNKKEFLDVLNHNWNFNSDQSKQSEWVQHAFVNSRDFDFAYEKWLHKRQEYLKIIDSQLSGHASSTKQLKAFIKQQNIEAIIKKALYTIDTKQNQINKLLATPLVFPRGIFDDKPTFIQGTKLQDSPSLFADWYTYANKQQHQFQSFYNLERDYTDFFEKATAHDIEVLKNKNNFSQAQQWAKIKIKQDLKIKQIKTQDVFLKLIAQELYNTIMGSAIELQLSDLYLTQTERLEKEQQALAQKDKPKGDYSDNFIWSKTIPFKEGQIAEPQVKLKDIGKFKNYIKTQKVTKLLEYDTTIIWNKQQLDDELFLKPNSYEVIRREFILKELQQLEKQILTLNDFDGMNHPTGFEVADQKGNRHPNFKKYIVNGLLQKFNLTHEAECKWLLDLNDTTFSNVTISDLVTKSEHCIRAFMLIYIRNKFAHNQLLEPKLMQYILKSVTKEEGLSYTEVILKYLKNSIAQITAQIPKDFTTV